MEEGDPVLFNLCWEFCEVSFYKAIDFGFFFFFTFPEDWGQYGLWSFQVIPRTTDTI